MSQRTVYVNEAFRPQRVSGQQRYAREISDRLPQDFVRVAPGPFWSRSSTLTWLWTLTVLPLRTWRGVLISMTARAPWYHPRHVLVVHDLFVIDHPEWFSRRYRWTHAPLLRFQLGQARSLVAVSEPVADEVRRLRPRAAVAVAPNAPSAVFSAPRVDDTAVLDRLGLRADQYAVVVGNLEPRKNLARLAEAYGQLNVQERAVMPLVIVGASAAIYGESRINWPSETVLTGYVDDSELASLYGCSRAVVFPSLAEGFGLPIVEAAAAGARALILSDLPVFHWIAGETALYFDPGSVSDMTRVLAGLPYGDLSPTAAADSSAGVRPFRWSDSARVIATWASDLGHRAP